MLIFSSGSDNNSSKADISRVDTIIGENAVIEGTLKSKDTIRVDGKLKGEGYFEGHLIIGESGKVEGNVSADSMLVAGEVVGNIQVKNKLEIAQSGKIKGDIVTKLLYIAEGAVFEGKSTMGAGSINTGASYKGSQNEETATGKEKAK